MNALKISSLEKKYKNFSALKNINFEIKKWDFFALLWVNGAGKSTLIWILTDLVKKTLWKVEVFWVDIDEDFSQAKRYIWVVPQEINLDIFSKVIDVLVIQAWYYGVSYKEAMIRAKKLLKELHLEDKSHSIVKDLSWGMKRRVMIARALMHQPKLLILDEPTAGIDINLRKSTYDFLQKLNQEWTTILLTTHYLEEVEILCNSLAVIKNGEILLCSSKDDFFATTSKNTFEITLEKEIWYIPDLEDFSPKIRKNILEISLPKNTPLNEIFEILWKNNISYIDIENKTNELESLFEIL